MVVQNPITTPTTNLIERDSHADNEDSQSKIIVYIHICILHILIM
jgi:hypothetical protein